MNERINNLRLDAGISTLHDAPYLVAINKSGEIIDPIIGLEKFAELIVFECTKAVMDGTKEGDHYAQRIEQHFGNGTGGILHFGVEE